MITILCVLVAAHYSDTGGKSANDCSYSWIIIPSVECDVASMVSLKPLRDVAKTGHPISNMLWHVRFYGPSMYR